MTFSYAILINNEIDEIDKLLSIIKTQMNTETDEIVVLQDSNASDTIQSSIKSICCDKHKVDVYQVREFKGNFAEHKNHLNSLCSKEWIVNLDADEYIQPNFTESLRELIETNDDIDTIKLPRINIINNASKDFLLRAQLKTPGYGWSINTHNHINFPDYQERVYKNVDYISWKGDVHEIVSGAKNQSSIPPDYKYKDYFIIHEKEMSKQFLQNYKYLNIMEDMRFKEEYSTHLLYNNYSDLDFGDVTSNALSSDRYKSFDTIVITNFNDDYEFDSLSNILTNINSKIIYLTNNYKLYLYLQLIEKTIGKQKLESYFIGVEEISDSLFSESEFYFNVSKVLGDDVIRFYYTINQNKKTAVIRSLFNLRSNFIII